MESEEDCFADIFKPYTEFSQTYSEQHFTLTSPKWINGYICLRGYQMSLNAAQEYFHNKEMQRK
jgi:hypothetical protein